MTFMRRINDTINQWFFQPEDNAAGRLGIFRIVWAIFVLAMALATFQDEMTQMPLAIWFPVKTLVWLDAPPQPSLILTMTIIRIVAVVFVLFGYRTRLSTLVILIAAIFLEGLTFSFGKQDHNDTAAYIYIPAMMLLYNWGQTYSIDALIRLRQGKTIPNVHDSSWHHGWPIKLMLVILAILYFGAAYIKITRLNWVTNPNHLSNLLLSRDLFNHSALRYWIATTPLIIFTLQIMTLLFEGLFPLTLINKTWRTVFLCGGVIFHFSIYILMQITFHQLVFVYALFLDWQQIGERLGLPALFERLKNVSTGRLIAMPISAAFIAALLRLFILPQNTLEMIEPVLMFLIWGIGIVIAIAGLLHSIPRLINQILIVISVQKSAANAQTST